MHPVEGEGDGKGQQAPGDVRFAQRPGFEGAAHAAGVVQGEVHLTDLFAGGGQHGAGHQGGDLAAGGQAGIG